VAGPFGECLHADRGEHLVRGAQLCPRVGSAATSSSGPGAAVARCHARRSGSRSRSVASASARCTARRSGSDAVEYTAERTSGCRNRTRVPVFAWFCSRVRAASHQACQGDDPG
jgi:hypothetical protein